jgi:FkbM family methyltransferase
MKAFLKKYIKLLPIDFTQNQRYDTETKKIIKLVCNENSVCVDIGCHKGEIFDLFIKQSPKQSHIGFEPIPFFAEALKEKYEPIGHQIFQIALSNQKGKSSFNFVENNPAYSGLKQRTYKSDNEKIIPINVETNLLDNIIDRKIDFIKIDVEGGELQVLEGASETIKKYHPTIIFEHGLGASEFYESTPQKIFEFFKKKNYHLSTMKNFLLSKKEFDLSTFEHQFYTKKNYYFIAYPI